MKTIENKETELRQIIIDNPGLELVPFVSEDCGGEYSYTLTSFSTAKVDEYTTNPFDDEKILFKSDGWNDDFEAYYLDNDPEDREEIPDEEIIAAFEALPWVKGIIVYIDAY